MDFSSSCSVLFPPHTKCVYAMAAHPHTHRTPSFTPSWTSQAKREIVVRASNRKTLKGETKAIWWPKLFFTLFFLLIHFLHPFSPRRPHDFSTNSWWWGARSPQTRRHFDPWKTYVCKVVSWGREIVKTDKTHTRRVWAARISSVVVDLIVESRMCGRNSWGEEIEKEHGTHYRAALLLSCKEELNV